MITRFYKVKLYIGVQTHKKDAWGDWQQVTSAKVFHGKPDMGFWGDEVYVFTPQMWDSLRKRIQKEAMLLERQFAEVREEDLKGPPLLTSYPIWSQKGNRKGVQP